MTTSHYFLAAGLAASLSACTPTLNQADETFGQRNLQLNTIQTSQPPAAQTGPVIHSANPVLGVLVEPSTHGDKLPKRCNQPVNVIFNTPMTLYQIVAEIAAQGISVQIDPRYFSDPDERANAAAGAAAAGAAAAAAANPPAPALPASALGAFPWNGRIPPGVAGPAYMSTQPAERRVVPNFGGSCEQVFDDIATQFDLAWKMRGSSLYFDKYLTRTFTVHASATTIKTSSSVSGGTVSGSGGGGGGGGGGSGGNQDNATNESNNDVWADIEKALSNILPKNARFAVSRASGTVTVLTTPRNMDEIASYFDQYNAVLSGTVMVQVSAIYITEDNNDSFGLDLSTLYNAGAKGGMKIGTDGLLPTLSQQPGTGSIAIIAPPAGTNNFATHFAGTQVFLNAVTSKNRLSDFRTATETGRNGITMPISLTTDQDIVKNISYAVTGTIGTSQTTASSSTINYGFSLAVTPRIISPGVISVFLNFNETDLTSLVNFQVGTTGTLQLATIDHRKLWNERPIRSGETYVIAGTEQETTTRTDQAGIGGGQKQGQVKRTRLILLVTPTIMANPNDRG